MAKTIELRVDYQNYTEMPQQQKAALWGQACSNDGATMDAWRDIWLKQTRENKAHFGNFADHSLGQLFGRHQFIPAVVCGSGPSLAENGEQLKELDPRIPIVSCLHNFHWHVDKDVRCDYFVTLDAGAVTIEEVSEGGEKTEEEYWEATKNYKLLAFIGSHPTLLKKWRGEIFLFNCPIPDPVVVEEFDKIEPFHCYTSTGGNVLGCATYIAKAIFGCYTVAFLGANFAFSYKDKFHGWDSKYDKSLGSYIKTVDVYGIPVKTWPSYANFKAYFDHIVLTVPGIWINCTEGGTLGATPNGNLRQCLQMDLKDFIDMVTMNRHVKESCANPLIDEKKILY